MPEEKKDLLKDNRPKRLELIKALEKKRGGRVIVYFTGDRAGVPARIAEDAVRPLIEHLLKMSQADKIGRLSLFLYSRGGDALIPWKIVAKVREFSDEFEVLIPFRAHSAATMICLGADSVVIGKNGELGPIDPSFNLISPDKPWPREARVEDVSAYIDFVKNRAGITDQNALSHMISKLTDDLEPTIIGRINRTFSHIRLVARKLLTSRKEKIEEDKIKLITEALTEKMYEHGHAISPSEAKELGLPVRDTDAETESLMWELYIEYENAFDLQSPIQPETLRRLPNIPSQSGEIILNDLPTACVESQERLDVFRISVSIKPIYEVPQVSPNVNLTLDQALTNEIQKLAQGNQRSLQRMLDLIQQQAFHGAQKAFAELLNSLALVKGYHQEFFNGGWNHEA